MYDVESGKTSKLKKAYVVENGKAVKLKKAYVVENGKLAKLWSSASPLFVLTSSNGAMVSEDLNTWDSVTFPTSMGGIAKSVVYGNGMYVVAPKRIYSSATVQKTLSIAYSSDGRSWTIKTLDTVGVWQGMAITTQLSFCNGQFIIVCNCNNGTSSYSRIYHTYTSSDGKTWTKINSNVLSQVSTADTTHIVYGLYDSKYRYLCPSAMSSGLSVYSYSNDLITWTQMSNHKAEAYIYDLFVTVDEKIYMACQGYYMYQITATGLSKKIWYTAVNSTTTISGYCYNPDANEIAITIAAPQYPSFQRFVNDSLKTNKSIISANGRLGTYTSSIIYGGGKYVYISTTGSSSGNVDCFYSTDGGQTWTNVVLGTSSNTGVHQSNDAICFGSGE